MVGAPKDSGQPGHPPSPIRVFAVRLMGSWGLIVSIADSEDSDQTGRTCRFVGFVMRRLIGTADDMTQFITK